MDLTSEFDRIFQMKPEQDEIARLRWKLKRCESFLSAQIALNEKEGRSVAHMRFLLDMLKEPTNDE
jgi:hypothetical protein